MKFNFSFDLDCCHKHGKPYFTWHVGPTVLKESMMPLELSMTNEEKTRVMVHPMTAAGNAVTVDGPVSFEVTAGDCTIEVVDDMTAFIVSGADPGDSSVLVKADADLGAGVVEIMDTVVVHVAHANASSLGLAADAPVIKTP